MQHFLHLGLAFNTPERKRASVPQSSTGTEFVDFWESKGVRVRKSLPLSAQSNGAIERQYQGVIKAMAAAKAEGKHWKTAMDEYIHTHNTRKHHSRLGITPFELLVGWRYRGTFPCLWESKQPLDRLAVREDDAFAKLVSKTYADKHRGAKDSNIMVGDRVVIAIVQKTKTDPTFSNESYTVLARDGAKVVLVNERGTKLTRNVSDVKRALEVDDQKERQQHSNSETLEYSEPKIVTQTAESISNSRTKREVRLPERFKNAVV